MLYYVIDVKELLLEFIVQILVSLFRNKFPLNKNMEFFVVLLKVYNINKVFQPFFIIKKKF